MSIQNIIATPTLAKLKTTDGKNPYINTQMIVSIEKGENNNETDLLMLNGQKFTLTNTPEHFVSNYQNDCKKTASVLNLAC
ncbi:MAG: hypothetical protein E7Z90_03725 [Cyanobacteria bacterium SIG29]|nr:hypothetical protein [Cyanobacteria bacterium SIG29]